MNFAVILAGGVGSRVKNISIPKQFVELGGKPVIVYTMENMLKVKKFDCLFIAVHKEWIDFMHELIEKYFDEETAGRIYMTVGGKERIDSIRNVTDAIQEHFKISTTDVIVIHDAARPFVTEKILNDSIDSALKYGAVVAALPASDTILHSYDHEEVAEIPDRNIVFHGQAPDSFRLALFLEMQDNLTEDQKKIITGTSQICTLNGVKLHMVQGDSINFKITTDSDLIMAENLVISRKDC